MHGYKFYETKNIKKMNADDILIDKGHQAYIVRSDLVDFIKNQLNVYMYSHIENKTQNRNNPDKIFNSNFDFWKSILENECHNEQIIRLEKFHLTEWIPTSPGLFYTYESIYSRRYAQRLALFYNKDAFEKKIHAQISYNLRNSSEEFQSILNSLGEEGYTQKQLIEYTPEGKENMIKGGIGSLRLANKFIYGRECYILGASSTGVSHEGIPLIVEMSLYRDCISKIKENGGFIVNLIGRLKIIPNELSLIKSNKEIPRYCIYIENLEFIKPSNNQDLYSSIVILYYRGNNILDQNMSFCYFNPDRKDNGLKRAVNWLEDYALRYSRSSELVIEGDFDEHITHFDKIDFPIHEIANGKISKETLLKYKDFFHFEINETVMGNKFENISNSTIVVNSNNVSIDTVHDKPLSDINSLSSNHSKKEIQDLISKGKIGKSLTLLLSSFKDVEDNEARNKAILYNSQFSELRTKENSNTISYDDASRERTRITMALIELIDEYL